MAVLFSNNAASNLSASITNTATSLSVTAGTGAEFPNPGGSDYFYATLSDATGNIEIIKVTARSTDTLTIVRGQDGTTARAWANSDKIELRLTAAGLGDLKADTLALVNNGLLTITAGAGLTGSGTFYANQAGNTTISLAHSDTSSQASSTNSGATVIQSIGLDGYGHLTSLTTKTIGYADVGAPSTTGTNASGTWGISISGSSASTTGNAATATTLQTARTINGVSFNGSANITITADPNSHTHSIDTITDEYRVFNNMGSNHSSYTDFNASRTSGANYMQGGTNGPTGTASHQFYGFKLGLGNDYDPASQYASQLYWARQAQGGGGYLWARDMESGSWGSWRKMYAGYADSAGSADSVAWTNVSGRPTAVSSFTNDSGYITSSHYHDRIYNGASSSGAYLLLSAGNELEYFSSSGVLSDLYIQYSGSQTSLRGPGGAVILNSTNWSSYISTGMPTSGGTFTGVVSAPAFKTTGAYGSQAQLGSISASWGGQAYPTLYSDTADRWVMHINPHISYVQNGVNGYTGSTYGAMIRFASNTAAATYWDAGVLSLIGSDTWGVARAGSWRMYVDSGANFYAAGNIQANSDERLKKDWVNVAPDFVEQIAAAKSGTYTRTDSGARQAGSSAQDWEKILPEVVSAGTDGTLALAYGNAALVSAVELAKRVVAQEARIKRLETIIENLAG